MTVESRIIQVEFAYLPVINFAMQQNRVSVVRKFSIENLTDEPLTNVQVLLSAEPGFAMCETHVIEAIPPKETIRIESLKLNMSPNFFAQLTERMAGNLVLEIATGDVSIFRQAYPIDILAFDQWGGTSVLPEMLSSFVTPNHPAIVPIIKRAASILEQWTGSASLDEYQSRNPNRVRKQMAAIYAAIAEQNITYSTVPASFEEYGQRIRLVDTALSQKLGTCLDMALLYASCLEAVGIYPLIVAVQGHAFAGGWLVPEIFPDSVTDDVSFLSKRIADGINEITLVETTCMNQGNDRGFEQAVKSANLNLLPPENFVFALDVQRSRYAGIRPLPQRILNGQQWEIKEEKPVEEKHLEPSSVNPYDLSGISSDIQVTKQLLWERKLLDLSLRNNLLNLRITKNTLQLISADLDKFEDALAVGEEFVIFPKPIDWDHPLYTSGLHSAIDSSDPITELVKSELSQKRLRSYLGRIELQQSLLHLYRSSRISMEENGANTLYLALGFLKWFETPASERPRYAPILLLPVEIIRKSAAVGYVIRSREEDAMMNITLLEMLRQNFGITISGLDPLPLDDSGVNTKLIFSIIRNSIKNQRKWDVEEQAVIGIFSFNKFIMWNDIHSNAHKLAQNKLVLSLMNGKIEWDVRDDMADAAALDKELSPADIVLPINADSSQFEAVFEAINDKSFILHGPPGTGKSQTITNIIANALYKGKRVLFVAEKMAALSVVQKRLAAIGLAPFCLELHSNKTKKSSILAQLKTTTEVVRQVPPENFGQEAERLHTLRADLNIYIEALHKKYPFGLSLYDAITRYSSIDSSEDVPFPTLPNDLTSGVLSEWEECVENMSIIGKTCGHPHQHPLTGIDISSYSPDTKEKASQNMSEIISLLSALKPKIETLSAIAGKTGEGPDKKQTENLIETFRIMLSIPELTPELLLQTRLNEVLEEYGEAAVHGKTKDTIKKEISATFMEEILSVDAKLLLIAWGQSANKWFLPKYFGQRRIKKQLSGYSGGHVIKTEDVKNILTEIIRYQDEDKYLARFGEYLPALFGKYGKQGNEDWNAIAQIVEDMATLNTLILNCAKDVMDVATIKESLARQLAEGIAVFRNMHKDTVAEITRIQEKLATGEERLYPLLGVAPERLYGHTPRWIDNAMTCLQCWLTNIDQLKDWYRWLVICRKADQLNIGFVATAYVTNNIPANDIVKVFEKSLCRALIHHIIEREPALDLFKGELFNNVIRKYKELARRFEDITQKELYAKLAANIPSFVKEAAQNSEVGILQRNIKNNGRGISIRKLFDQIPTLLSRMCPCMLMSPISVAQYIDPDADKFDLVVFDEASQMPTYEAAGAIARGKNIVIVGDPKQMPPTNFFNVNNVDEDNIEMEDLESILDDCLALSMPSKYLLWHYRSKHESLIAFSNSEYYDNKLLTFPSPDNIESKVRLIPVQGFYDKGKTRQNITEARAVVAEIERRLVDENLRKRSIGVVTFSVVQQALVEDLLSELFVGQPQLETYALECAEPLFIKNLENVQGDERDIILFSVGYGPDVDGRTSMNFGPLNRLGGERRLNVAVSRARYEMLIYSTLRSDQIDLNRTSSIGVAGLKRFLEYAEHGKHMPAPSNANAPKALEQIVAKELAKKGYKVHTNIGCSGYRIDIGVVDKSIPTNYILGILCDGTNYAQTKTARDREIVQTSVLQQLGWNIHRVWTMDWWENPQAVVTKIEEAIRCAEEHNGHEAEDIVPSIPGNRLTNEVPGETIQKVDNPVVQEQAGNTQPGKNGTQEYHSAVLVPVNCPPESFSSSLYREHVISHIRKVVEVEAPISRPLLCKKVLTAWNISRTGARIDAYFDSLLNQLSYHQVTHDNITFVWTNQEQRRQYTGCRPDSPRDAVDLPPEELANAIHQLLQEQISLPVKDLNRITAQFFGFARSGSNVEAAVSRGIKEAVARGYIKTENDRAVIH